jgi:hypothetical protein
MDEADMRRPSIEIDKRDRLRTRTEGARNDLDQNPNR